MNRVAAIVFLLGGMFFAWGTEEHSRIVQVNKNGSGVIMVRVLYNPAELVEGQKIYDEAKLQAANYGRGVRYVISKEVEAKNGWKGYLAKYHFSDIAELRLFPTSLPRAASAEDGDDIKLSGWRFQLSEMDDPGEAGEGVEGKDKEPKEVKEPPKETKDAKDGKEKKDGPAKLYVLDIIPLIEDVAAEGAAGGDAPDEKKKGIIVAEDVVHTARQKGRRYVDYIQVEGEIVEKRTTAPNASKKVPGTVVLNDEQFEQMWKASDVAREEILAEEPNFSLLDPQNTPGYRCIFKRAKITFR